MKFRMYMANFTSNAMKVRKIFFIAIKGPKTCNKGPKGV